MSQSVPKLSIIIPVFDEVRNIGLLVDKVEKAISDQVTFEVIIVDNADSERMTAELVDLFEAREIVRVVFHTQDYSEQASIDSGISVANATTVAVLDCDFENDPATLSHLYDRLHSADDIQKLVGDRLRQPDCSRSWGSSNVASFIRPPR